MWLLLMFRISPRRIPVSSATMMILFNSPEQASSFSSSPASNLLSLPLAILGNDTIETGLLWRLIPHSLIAVFMTLLQMTSSLFNDAGDTAFNLVSRYLQIRAGESIDTVWSPRCLFKVFRRYFSTWWLLCWGDTSSSYPVSYTHLTLPTILRV